MKEYRNLGKCEETHKFQNVVKTIGGSMIYEDTTLQQQKTTVCGPWFFGRQTKTIEEIAFPRPKEVGHARTMSNNNIYIYI